MEDDQKVCLRWNNHQKTLKSYFHKLLDSNAHADCELFAEGQCLKAHKVILSACSPYFENLFEQQYNKSPIFILIGFKYQDLRALMEYMYRGEINVSPDQLPALLKVGETLKIIGLSDLEPDNDTPAMRKEMKPRRIIESVLDNHEHSNYSERSTLPITTSTPLITTGTVAIVAPSQRHQQQS